MPSTFFGLNIGQSGLYAYQTALDTTAHNITNAETEGYTRQVISQKAGKALSVSNSFGMVGTGVNVSGVTQLRDEYYDTKYRANSTMYGEYKEKAHYMTEVENYLNDLNDNGFTTSFNSMYDSLQELQKNPSSLTVRTQVLNYAEGLTDYFNSMATKLKGIQEECNFEIKNQVDNINSISQQIASLTKQINTLEVNGGTANDLRDQRALLIDNLSQIATVSVAEKKAGIADGVTSFSVTLDGVTLVDGYNTKKLTVVPKELKNNQNDAEGLYEIVWEDGQRFGERSKSLGGTLQALLEVRDGNNQMNLRGSTDVEVGDNQVVLIDANINSVEKMNIPETGVITIDNREYNYTGFQVTMDDSGENFVYTFELEKSIKVNYSGDQVHIGDSINYKGIPYYMEQLNEFARTYAKTFNEIHRTGVDLNGDAGMDVFNATNKISGRNYTFGPLNDSDDKLTYDYNTFNSQTGGYYTNVSDDQPLYGSYYFMTAENLCITKKLANNSNLLATATNVENGLENHDVVDQLIALKSDKTMFKQGDPASFFDTLIAEVGIDTNAATTFSDGQSNIMEAIQNQRLSISGVDTDEEAMNLVRFQNAYNLSAKVITVMNEIYDKMINNMGV